MSWKGEVTTTQTDHINDKDWAGNALRFATYKEAENYINDLSYRWTSVRHTRVVESDDPVNYSFANYVLTPIAA